MNWHEHSELKSNQHALFGGSNYHWINYDEDKLIEFYINQQAKEEGTKLHSLASELINRGIKLAKSKKTFNSFVNDCIGFRMRSEQPLKYSDKFFGTADAIKFDDRKRKLMIFDLKTGKTPAHMEQLMVYSAFFCLEYNIPPHKIAIELRIYQNDDVLFYIPEPEEIWEIMSTIEHHDKVLDNFINKE